MTSISEMSTRVGCKRCFSDHGSSDDHPPSKRTKVCSDNNNGDIFDGGSSVTNFFFSSASAASSHQEKMICILEENQTSDESNLTSVGNSSINGRIDTSDTNQLAEKEVPDQSSSEELLSLSNTKALRAAELKSRFADLIAKSQRTLQDQGKKGDPMTAQLNNEKSKGIEHKG